VFTGAKFFRSYNVRPRKIVGLVAPQKNCRLYGGFHFDGGIPVHHPESNRIFHEIILTGFSMIFSQSSELGVPLMT